MHSGSAPSPAIVVRLSVAESWIVRKIPDLRRGLFDPVAHQIPVVVRDVDVLLRCCRPTVHLFATGKRHNAQVPCFGWLEPPPLHWRGHWRRGRW